ncbi:MAG: S9 family peptidase [Gemmatimonadota bacterium]
MTAMRIHRIVVRSLVALVAPATLLSAQTKRPMTFMDAQRIRNAGSFAVSPDGKSVLYTLSVLDWKEAKRFTDIYLVSAERGVSTGRQLTFTKDKNEINPAWSRDGGYFVFASNRDGTGPTATNQLYAMRADGGEATKITDAKDGVGSFAFSRDGKWLAYSVGKPDDQQVWTLRADQVQGGDPKPMQLTRHATPVTWWQLSRDGGKLFFLAPDSVDRDDKARLEKKFDVKIRNQDLPLQQLWTLDLATREERRLTGGRDYSAGNPRVSRDGKWIVFTGMPNDRYKRTVTESGDFGDLYLLDVASGKVERLTTNEEAGESDATFSPDGQWIAFAAPNDFAYSRDNKLYLRRVADAGGTWRKLGENYDGSMSIAWWSADGKTLYFGDGVKATFQVLALDLESTTVRPVVAEPALAFPEKDDDTGVIVLTYANAKGPAVHYVVRSDADLPDRSKWVQITDPNPFVSAELALGNEEEITWKSKDGRMVSGVLIKPVGFTAGRRYPLIVQIHGGPAGADMLGFNPGYGSQVYAGAGYAVLLPNYRGSSNYGEQHRMETAGVGKYFDRGFDDIMSGVDYLIAQGIAHPDSLGAMGWSAGGHYSNWILTHTDRFKAISSGAGTMNWISMYAESDIQRNRQWYMGGKLPYDDFDAYWRVSPLKYIKNAKTPTLIHVVDGDPRVPRPQSEELHMALKRLGVPTEFFVYPGSSHGIPDPRNQLTKGIVEFNWFEKWIRGKPGWFEWKEMLKTLDDDSTRTAK